MRRSSFKGLVAAGLMATSIVSSTSVVSASDMFLKISGVKGESQDSKHKDSIDVLSWSWGTSTGTGKVKRGSLAPQCIQDRAVLVQVYKFFNGWKADRGSLEYLGRADGSTNHGLAQVPYNDLDLRHFSHGWMLLNFSMLDT